MNPIANVENQSIAPIQNTNYSDVKAPETNLFWGASVASAELMKTKALGRRVSTVHEDIREFTQIDLNDFDLQRIKQALQKVRTEAEEERRIDPELDTIPETAYEDVEGFFKAIYKSDYGAFGKIIPLPDIMPLDDGEIGLEWRNGQKIFTLSFGGDGHIVFAGILSEESRVRGILTSSSLHLVAITSMIASVYRYYAY